MKEAPRMASEGITIVVGGHPVAKGRNQTRIGKDGRIITQLPTKTRRWEQDAKEIARRAMDKCGLYEGCLSITVHVGLAVPSSWPAWKQEAALDGKVAPAGRPDLDNIVKAAKDAFNGVVWRDDSQIVRLMARKFYVDKPSVTVNVEPYSALSSRTAKKVDLEAALKHIESRVGESG